MMTLIHGATHDQPGQAGQVELMITDLKTKGKSNAAQKQTTGGLVLHAVK